MQVSVHSFNQTMEKSHQWLRSLVKVGDFSTIEHAYSALRAVLHSLRDCLPVNEVANLASQLPMLIRGLYYDGWKPNAISNNIITQEDFLEDVKKNLGSTQGVPDVKQATIAVFKLLTIYISEGEVNHIKNFLQSNISTLWE